MEEQKYMTLKDLFKELRKEITNMTSGDIPLRINGKKVISVEPDTVTDGECHVIECNLNIKMQSNLDRLKEIAEPAPTDWREVAEERRKNRKQYHKDLHEWLSEKVSEKISNDIDKEIVIMTNEEIAELIVNDYVGRCHSYYSTVYDAVMTALQLKDTQERDLFECSREANRKEEIKKEEVRNEEVVKQRDKKTSVC